MTLRTLLLLILSLTFTCCTNKPSDLRLSRIESLSSESPKEAWDSLSAINYDLLSDADKHYYDFLSVKVADKAYITHYSDSLILKVINFESKHQKYGRYPEALYYGGRVYSDLGDYPTALHYFQNALDLISANSKNSNLRANIISQYGRLLTSIRLYDDAIPYITESIEIGQQNKDTTNIIYDLQLLGGTYLRAAKYEDAEKCFKKALQLSKNRPCFHSAKSLMYLAAIKSKLEQTDSALLLIRDTPNNVKQTVRNTALGYAADIYLKAGIRDTAYQFAHEIICSQDSAPKEIGYQVLLSPELRGFIHADSINKYISDYRSLLESFYDDNQTKLAINQRNLYNYQLHEREKAKAEKSNDFLKFCILVFLLVIILLALGFLYLKNRNKAYIIGLHEALENIKELKVQLNETHEPSLECMDSNQSPTVSQEPIPSSIDSKEENLRDRLKNELMELYEKANTSSEISPIILQSEVYQKLQSLISNNKTIKEDDSIWFELEKIILHSSPKFIQNLNLLTSGSLTTIDLHTALLIKCGFKPSQMKTLFGRSNGTIVSRRETLCLKVLDKKLGTKVIDAIIRLL